MMDPEMSASFCDVAKEIHNGVKDERLRCIALMVNDMAHDTVELAQQGLVDIGTVQSVMAYTRVVISLVTALDAGVDPVGLRAGAPRGPDVVSDFFRNN
jgi:hypothetical protein